MFVCFPINISASHTVNYAAIFHSVFTNYTSPPSSVAISCDGGMSSQQSQILQDVSKSLLYSFYEAPAIYKSQHKTKIIHTTLPEVVRRLLNALPEYIPWLFSATVLYLILLFHSTAHNRANASRSNMPPHFNLKHLYSHSSHFSRFINNLPV